MEILKQGRNSPLSVEHQVIIIYAVVNNFLKDIKVGDISEFEKDLFEFIDNSHPDIISSIKETKELTKENEMAINDALTSFVNSFISSR